MKLTVIEGKEYYHASYVAKEWGYKESTIKRYACLSSGKLPGCVKHKGGLYVPAGSVRPITEGIAQGLLWGIVKVKNDPGTYLDLTAFEIDNAQLESVLNELSRQLYLQIDKDEPDLRKRLLGSRITDKGFKLIEYRKRFSENPVKDKPTAEYFKIALTGAQAVVQFVQLVRSIGVS